MVQPHAWGHHALCTFTFGRYYDALKIKRLHGTSADVCRSWSERHAHTAEQLRHGSTQELQLPTHFWLSSDCRAPLGKRHQMQTSFLCNIP